MKPAYEESVAILKERVALVGEALASLDRRPQHDDGREPGQQSLPLSADQRAEIAWCGDAPEPGGG